MRTNYVFIAGNLIAALAFGCSNRADDCDKNASCGTNTGGSGGAGGTGNTGGTGGAGGDGGGCDTTKPPSTESCLVADDYAVFVDGTVATTGTGTRSSPMKTIAEGLAAAKTSGKIVLVCDTTYDEQVKVDFGAKVYGGFKCADWTYETGKRAVVKPTARGHALEVDTVSDPVVVEDMEFEAQAGVDAGEGSVAAFVKSSTNVSLMRVKLIAGAGKDGSAGSLTTVQLPAASALQGNSATNDIGAPVKNDCVCTAGGSTAGGAGGNGGPGATGGGAGQPSGSGGKAGTNSGATCTAGGNGSAGPGDKDGLSPTATGSVSALGWQGASGPDGQPGMPGQGGGGGGGSTDGGAGGSGACGGCGGAAATGGKAGGSSIGLVALDSSVAITQSEIVTANAATGGAGIAGQPGQSPGGAHGNGFNFGCDGGNGGPGGGGGASAGGAGGVSVGIVYKGATAPTTDTVNYTLGQLGAKGDGGVPGTNDGIDGVAENTLQVQ